MRQDGLVSEPWREALRQAQPMASAVPVRERSFPSALFQERRFERGVFMHSESLCSPSKGRRMGGVE